MSLSVSPFASALPNNHVFHQYDADGDAIMTDAATGLPITYGMRSRIRSRSPSADSDDSRPSKRSRLSDEERVPSPFGDLSPIRVPSGAAASGETPCAPIKVSRPPHDDDDEDGHGGALRNLAEELAEAALAGEPRDDAAAAAPAPSAPPAGEDQDGAAAAAGPADGWGGQDWCVSVRVSDLALRLDMRHPRVVLNLLRFVDTYNELAPYGEAIHMPLIPRRTQKHILAHESVVNPVPEFAAEIAELRDLLLRYSTAASAEEEEEDDDHSSVSSHDSYYSGPRYSRY